MIWSKVALIWDLVCSVGIHLFVARFLLGRPVIFGLAAAEGRNGGTTSWFGAPQRM